MHRLLTFGGLALRDDEGRLPVSSVRGRNLALLALLARAGAAGRTRERLAAWLWPESDAARARHSLDQALYTIRRALDADPFVSGAGTLALDGAVLDSDVAAFERRLQRGDRDRAVELYGGPFLEGFHLSGARSFERWVDTEQAKLHAGYTEALEALAREAEADGDAARAVACWRRLSGASPLSSRVTLELMRALDRAGDRAKALQAARAHTARVKEELGAAPDGAVLEYAEELADRPPWRFPGPAASGAGVGERRSGVGADVASEGAGGGDAGGDGDEEDGGRSRAAAGEPAGAAGPGGSGGVRRMWPMVGLAAAAALVAAFASVGGPADPAGPPRVAVAPFTDEGGDPELAVLGRMTADWITVGLVRSGIVQVVRPDAGTGTVRSVVEGRIYRRGDSVWIRARIGDPADGAVLRSLAAVGAPAADPVPALEPLRRQVMAALGTLYDPRIAAWRGTALRPPTWEAYQAFAAGVERHAVPRDLPGAAEQFRRAARLDPGYTLPRLWLAWATMLMRDYAAADSVARSLVPRRGEMSPLERAWHDRIVALLAGDDEGSYRAARRMVEIAPGSGWAIALASAALDTRRPGVAIATLRETGIDNLGREREHGWSLFAAAHHMSGDYEGELAVAERAIEADGLDWGFVGPGVPGLAALGRVVALERRLEEVRDLPPAYGAPRGPASALAAVTELRGHGFRSEAGALADRLLDRPDLWRTGEAAPAVAAWFRLQLLYEAGRWGQARALLESLRGREADRETDLASDRSAGREMGLRLTAMAGLLAARSGDAPAARAIDRELDARDPVFLFGEASFWRARLHAVLGEREAAIRLVRRAYSEGVGSRGWHRVHTTRDFEALRRDDAFRRLVGPRDP